MGGPLEEKAKRDTVVTKEGKGVTAVVAIDAALPPGAKKPPTEDVFQDEGEERESWGTSYIFQSLLTSFF